MRVTSESARAGTIASSSGASPSMAVSRTDMRYESVAAITSLAGSKRTSTPVSTGRDSSREAARLTCEAVSTNVSASMVKSVAPAASGKRGKSSALSVFSR